MNPAGRDLPQVYLKAGEIVFSDTPQLVLTVLGSCLSITLFHRRSGRGAISHGLLPHCRERSGCGGSCREMGKYVECSLARMLTMFRDAGVPLRELEVKVFGGADMFTRRADAKAPISVGKQNIEMAREAIGREGMKIVSMDVGGNQGRKLFFNTATGDVMLKRLMPNVIIAEPVAQNK